MSAKKWYALYTRPRWEKKVSALLNKKNIENYCPLNKVVRQWSDRKKTVQEPLFTCYVFVFTNEKEHVAIRETDGVLNFVYWLRKPAEIKAEDIATLKSFLADHYDVKLEKMEIRLNDEVRITGGPLILYEGKVVEVTNKHVKVFLPSLGYAMLAEISKNNIEVLQPKIGNDNAGYNTSKRTG